MLYTCLKTRRALQVADSYKNKSKRNTKGQFFIAGFGVLVCMSVFVFVGVFMSKLKSIKYCLLIMFLVG